MNERRSGFAPGTRSKEKVLEVPEGKELTRIDGKMVLVTAKDANELYYGNSPYTLRQFCEIFHIRQTALEKKCGK